MTIVSCFFFFKQKTAYDMRISDWSSDVCSSDLRPDARCPRNKQATAAPCPGGVDATHGFHRPRWCARASAGSSASRVMPATGQAVGACRGDPRLQPRVHRRLGRQPRAAGDPVGRSEEHTSELQSLMRISYAVFCLKKKISNTSVISPTKYPQ